MVRKCVGNDYAYYLVASVKLNIEQLDRYMKGGDESYSVGPLVKRKGRNGIDVIYCGPISVTDDTVNSIRPVGPVLIIEGASEHSVTRRANNILKSVWETEDEFSVNYWIYCLEKLLPGNRYATPHIAL